MRKLQHRRTELLQQMAELKVDQVRLSRVKDDRPKQPWADQLKALEEELDLIEQQIRVVNKYIQRLHHGNPADKADQRPAARPTTRGSFRATSKRR
jgi:hypothetical protein